MAKMFAQSFYFCKILNLKSFSYFFLNKENPHCLRTPRAILPMRRALEEIVDIRDVA